MDIKSKAIKSSADFSDCAQYRYNLKRKFSEGCRTINFIMLNPSTANELVNDPTIAKCENRTIKLGFNKLVITNLFAFRATNPNDMMLVDDPIGEKNDTYILEHAKLSEVVVCAWGNHGEYRYRSQEVVTMLKKHNIKLYALKLNSSGEPAHPLYLANKLELFEWK